MSKMPRDSDGMQIPVLGYKSGGAQTIAVAAASARNATAFDAKTRVITIESTVECYFEQGDSSVTATTSKHHLAANQPRDISIGGGQTAHKPYIAVIRASSDGTLYISERD
ncbi:MAG: hypothetical protein IAE63_06755 [Alphaproteobacteria bacterium]|nr:hypothetical protein [Alphaproteobacteria bacterium]